MRDHMKMMWGCVVLIALAVVLGAVGVKGAFVVLLAIPCMLMMGAMVWMMLRMGSSAKK